MFGSLFKRREPVHRSAASDDLASLRQMLSARPEDVHARDGRGRTPLHVAARHGRAEAAHMLIEAGADVNAVCPGGQMPLHLACDSEVTTVLLRHGAVSDFADRDGVTPIMRATVDGDEDRVALLRAAGAKDFLVTPAVSIDEDDPFMLEAQGKARRSRDVLLALFPDRPRHACVRVPLVTDSRETEHLWADLLAVDGGRMKVRLRSYPRAQSPAILPIVQEFMVSDLVDWQVELADGTIRGGFGYRVLFDALRDRYGELPPEMVAQEKRYVDVG